jgi:carbon-monoxide dehydrogenase medium subunit
VIPAPFEYVAAESPAHALELLEQWGDDAKLLAGGHSLLPMMKLRLAAPEMLIDIGRLTELTGIRAEGDELVIGAATPHARLAASDLVQAEAPLLAHSAAQVGDPQIRHRGTIGGSLAHADPAADLPMALVALGGSVELLSMGGTRRVAADDFFAGYFETSLEPGELIASVRVPRRPGAAWGYQKFVRRANDWAIVGVATTGGRIALANMASVPLRAGAAEQALAEGASPARAAELAADGTEPGEDVHANREFRQHLARVLTRRALEHRTD